MIAALLLGREGSVGFPGKNLYPVLGRPLMEYPLLAALNAKSVDEVYLYGEKKRRNYEIIEKGVDKFKFSVTLVCEKTEKGWIINSGTIQKGEGLQRDSLGVAITVGTSAEAGVVFAKASVNASIQGSYNHSWETYRFGEEQDIQKYSKDVIGKPCK